MAVQYNVAIGKTKGATATQQTAAAKAWSELRIALQGLEEEADSQRYDLDTLTDRLDLLDHVASMSGEQVQRERERLAREAEEVGASPAPGAPPQRLLLFESEFAPQRSHHTSSGSPGA
jgi:hypothetical protein